MKRYVTQLVALISLSCAAPVLHAQQTWQMQPVALQTRWAKEVSPTNALPEYPRPQMVRNNWQNLNGLWDYAITEKDATQPVIFAGQILVPYPIESALSGVKKAVLPTQRLWYRRTLPTVNWNEGQKVLLHFGAVDWQTTVMVNGKKAGTHTGGYQPFSFDITHLLREKNNEILVSVYDPTDQGPNPHGKQVLSPKGIRYTASTGIWQTVWLETVPETYISNLVITPDVDNGYVAVTVKTAGINAPVKIVATAGANGKIINTAKGKNNETIRIQVPKAHLWSPDDPFLYDLSVKLVLRGDTADEVNSYFGMRKIAVKKDPKGQERLYLNDKYTYNLGVLDQGYWPDGLYTAPTDEALRFDIEATKAMGFNTIRKHIKIEPARWYYYADKLGMLVWQDMVTCASLQPAAKEAFEKECAANVAQLYNSPSVIAWVLFNEGWFTYDQLRLTKWIRSMDNTRLINGHTGENYEMDGQQVNEKWANADFADIHDYPGPGIAPALPGKARVLGEWGGIGVPVKDHEWDAAAGWGYVKITPAELGTRYSSMVRKLKEYEVQGQSGSIYTEPYDVEIEENGMMTYDRAIIKIPIDSLRKIHAAFIPQEASAHLVNALALKNADTTSVPDPYRAQFLSILELEADAKKTHDWKTLTDNVTDYLAKGGTSFSPTKISSIAKKVFDGTGDTVLLGQSLKWMERVVEIERNTFTMGTYANLLYRLGDKENALKWMYKSVELAHEEEIPEYQAIYDKMKKGEKTWQ